MQKIIAQIAQEIRVRPQQIEAAVTLLDGGATVPFIARYRKEVTGGLDDIQLRELEARLSYLRELVDRKQTILKSIEEQGKLTPALRLSVEDAATKQELEDIYLPFKPKRRTKGMIAREAGIEPLADALFADPSLVPADAAVAYVKAEKTEAGDDFTTVQAVLDGLRLQPTTLASYLSRHCCTSGMPAEAARKRLSSHAWISRLEKPAGGVPLVNLLPSATW